MYTSNREYTNRYGDKYEFVPSEDEPKKYYLEGELQHMRCGGKEGVEGIDMTDLGMIDPSGGPYIDIGTILDGKPITRLGLYAEVVRVETE